MKTDTRRITALLGFLFYVLCFWGFYEASLAYDAFAIPLGTGVNDVHPFELSFTAWYLLYGFLAVLSLTAMFKSTSVPARLESSFRRVVDRRAVYVGLLSFAVFGAVLLFRHFVLRYAPIADDESTYVFIARTLLQGRVINPLPGDNEFFENQWIVFNSNGWYGKYPIGHPLLLALGEAINFRFLVMPLIAALSMLLTYSIGRRIFGSIEAGLALALLALSPQFVMTSATELSQPTEMLFMLLALWFFLRVIEDRHWYHALGGGAALAYGVLVRPFPGVLFLAAAGAVFLLLRSEDSWKAHLRKRLPLALVAIAPSVICFFFMLWINQAQSGDALHTGYQSVHRSLGFFRNEDGQMSLSVAAAILRQNLWLFGWPLSFAFIPFGRTKERHQLALIWAFIAAEMFYRVLVPKTVVATTGPIYVMEIVPLLALLTASGVVNAKRWLEERNVREAKALTISFVTASFIVGLTMFVPVRVQGIMASSSEWNEVYRLLERRGVERDALVFSHFMVPMFTNWAYYPPPASPTLDDDILFVRPPMGRNRAKACRDFWRRRFPDRSPWLYHPTKGLYSLRDPEEGQEAIEILRDDPWFRIRQRRGGQGEEMEPRVGDAEGAFVNEPGPERRNTQ